jgi:dihydrofolate reductase
MDRGIDSMPELILVAAMARNRVIGHRGRMPWHLPADLKHFKAVTLGHPVVMGRKTFESIGKPLPGRLNVVVSRQHPGLPDGVVLAGSLDEALSACGDAGRVMVIGGGEIYRQALPLASGLELTIVDGEPDGDTRFPAFDRSDWELTGMTARPADVDNASRLVFCTFRRRGQ